MSGTSWLPRREQDLADLCVKWKAGLESTANVKAFGWDQVEATAVLDIIDGFLDTRTAYGNNNSTRNRVVKDAARRKAKEALRDFANASIRYNKRMKEEDKRYYGIRTRDPVSTPVSRPTTYPEAEADTSVIRQIRIHFWDSVTKKRGKPYGVFAAEIRWAILDHVPASVKELVNSSLDTTTPFALTFDESQRGQRLYFCLRWKSTTTLNGPDGEIYSAIIP
ncbi:MAG: hypothetical protein LBL20_05415 [Treponema sp.]|nr:hypothetical protein [Treponema sp.]